MKENLVIIPTYNEKENIEYGLQLRQKELDLEKEYSTKLLNVVPPQKVMALRGAEDDFRKLVIKQIQQRQVMQQQRQQQRDRNEQFLQRCLPKWLLRWYRAK